MKQTHVLDEEASSMFHIAQTEMIVSVLLLERGVRKANYSQYRKHSSAGERFQVTSWLPSSVVFPCSAALQVHGRIAKISTGMCECELSAN